ncbi:MAG: hypothetical protein AB1896_04530 [Thermodesulfobacteriota bacterium]
MTILLNLAVFILALFFSANVIAALFGLLDLSYALGRHWPRVLARIITWGGLAAAVALLLPGAYLASYLIGLAVYLVFFIGSAYVLRLMAMKLAEPFRRDPPEEWS